MARSHLQEDGADVADVDEANLVAGRAAGDLGLALLVDGDDAEDC